MAPPRVVRVTQADIDHAATAADAATVVQPGDIQPDSQGQSWGDWALDQAVNALPMVGGVAGGIVGGVGGTVGGFGVGGWPGAVAGAGIGGAGGEGFKNAINQWRGKEPVSPSVTSDLTDVGIEGGKQALYEAGGQSLMRGVPAAGGALYKTALGTLPAKITDAFPNVVDVLLKNRFPVTDAGRAAAVAARGRAAQGVRAILEHAGDNGVTFDAGSIAEQKLLELIDQVGKIPAGSPEEKALGNYIDDYLTRNPGPLSPQAVKDMKQAAQQISGPIFNAQAAGNYAGPVTNTYGQFNKAIAGGAQDALETIPGVAEGEAATQNMIGASRALKYAANRGWSPRGELGIFGVNAAISAALSHGSGVPAAMQNAAMEYLVTRGLLTRGNVSRAGLALTQPQVAAFFRQFPRVASEVIGNLTADQSPLAPQTPTPLGPLTPGTPSQ